jgi:hypothetical protein
VDQPDLQIEKSQLPQVIEPSKTVGKKRSCCYRLCCAYGRCCTNIYFWACGVYLVYTCQALSADYCWEVKIHEGQCRISNINDQYVALAAVHTFNAFQYLSCWAPFMKLHASLPAQTKFLLLFPECMNVVEGSMYLYSSLSYERIEKSTACEEDPKCDAEMFLHHWETAAASVECLASLFWCYSFYVVFNIETPKELGPCQRFLWAICDPELHSALLLVVGSVIYIIYYYQVDTYPDHYDTNMLWETGDIIYFIGALLYLTSAMKLCGCFYFVTLPGWTDDWYEVDCGIEPVIESGPRLGGQEEEGRNNSRFTLGSEAGSDIVGDAARDSKILEDSSEFDEEQAQVRKSSIISKNKKGNSSSTNKSSNFTYNPIGVSNVDDEVRGTEDKEVSHVKKIKSQGGQSRTPEGQQAKNRSNEENGSIFSGSGSGVGKPSQSRAALV